MRQWPDDNGDGVVGGGLCVTDGKMSGGAAVNGGGADVVSAVVAGAGSVSTTAACCRGWTVSAAGFGAAAGTGLRACGVAAGVMAVAAAFCPAGCFDDVGATDVDVAAGATRLCVGVTAD